MRISNSEIQCLKRCKRKWWFTYYRNLKMKRPETAGPRQVGTRVHACVATYYDLKSDGLSDAEAQAAAMVQHDELAAEDVERSNGDSDTVKEVDLTKAILEGYFEWLEEEGADEGLTVIAAEETVDLERTVPGTSTPVTIGAKLDLRVRSEDGTTSFLDHKIVQEFTTPTRALHLDEQMLMYNWLLEQTTPGRVDGAIYNMMRKVKRTARANPPFYARFTVRHTAQEIESFRIRLIGELQDLIYLREQLDDGMDPRQVAYPTPTRNCSWDCDFFAVCHLMDRPQDKPEKLVSRLYVVGNPYERYDESAGNIE